MDRSEPLFDGDVLDKRGGGFGPAEGEVDARGYDPPLVDPALLDLTRRLSQRRQPVAVELGDAALAFSPRGLGTSDDVAPRAERVIFWFLIDGRPLVLKMARGLFDRLLARIDPELIAAGIDDEILPLLLESCLEGGLEAAEAGLGSRLELVRVEQGAAVDLSGPNVALDLSIDGERAGLAMLRAGRDDVERLAELFAARPKASRSYGDLSVALSFRASALWLDLGTLKALKPGDVLLAEEDDKRWERMAAVAGDHWLFPLEFTNEGLVVRGPFRRADAEDQEEWMMVEQNSRADDDEKALSDAIEGAGGQAGDGQEQAAAGTNGAERQTGDDGDIEAGPATAPADAAFDDLPIKLVFELGRLEMPLGQLQDIGAGHVFQLERPLGKSVEIHAGNRRIGQGEIVRIENQIGVRVVRLFGQSGA